jgi:phosphoribosylformylglycinamidine synthase subunit PurQ / glutaminase
MPAPLCKALVLRAPGTNCDVELSRAFRMAGAAPTTMHLQALIEHPSAIDQFDLIGLPGGFSYGDDIASGRIFAFRLRQALYPALREAVMRGCPVFAVCNGFQIAVQAGLLPGPSPEESWPDQPQPQRLSLAHNASGRFVDGWFPVRAEASSVCIWTRGLSDHFGEASPAMMLPIAHGEGRLVAEAPHILEQMERRGQIALRYGHKPVPPKPGAPWSPHPDNPNGSTADIAGICDTSGRVFGLMPHPERFLDWNRHPFFTRLEGSYLSGPTPAQIMFKNAVEAAAMVSR